MAARQLLDEALALSREMLTLGEQGEWERVIELEPQRREMLHRAFARQGPLNETDAGRIRDILKLDKSLIQCGIQARDAVAGELSQMRLGKKVAQAYRAVGE